MLLILYIINTLLIPYIITLYYTIVSLIYRAVAYPRYPRELYSRTRSI